MEEAQCSVRIAKSNDVLGLELGWVGVSKRTVVVADVVLSNDVIIRSQVRIKIIPRKLCNVSVDRLEVLDDLAEIMVRHDIVLSKLKVRKIVDQKLERSKARGNIHSPMVNNDSRASPEALNTQRRHKKTTTMQKSQNDGGQLTPENGLEIGIGQGPGKRHLEWIHEGSSRKVTRGSLGCTLIGPSGE